MYNKINTFNFSDKNKTSCQQYKRKKKTAAVLVVVVVTYPEANDLALKAVHDDNHLFRVRRRIREILTDTRIHSHNDDMMTYSDLDQG